MPAVVNKAFPGLRAYEHDRQRSKMLCSLLQLIHRFRITGSLEINQSHCVGFQLFLRFHNIFGCNYSMARLSEMAHHKALFGSL